MIKLLEGSNCCEDYQWEDLQWALDEIIAEVNPAGFWKARVKNFGWRSLNGHKVFYAHRGADILRNILPNTDCNFTIYKYRKHGLAINNFHHDSPMGAEWYYLTRISEREFQKERGE